MLENFTQRPIVLRNGGTVPVSVYFSMEVHDVFFSGGGFIALARRHLKLQVEFSPSSATPKMARLGRELHINTAQMNTEQLV